jgi:hypothetical protein
MKNIIYCCFLATVASFPLQAQNNTNLLELAHQIADPSHLFTEENQLALKTDERATSVYMPLLRRALGSSADTNVSQILDRMNGNPFINRGGGDPSLIWVLADAQSLGSFKLSSVATHMATPGTKVTTVADGIAKFLVNRAKEELTISFFKQFKEDLANDKRIGMLFPNTTATLMLVDDQIYQVSRYLESLRESFIRDFKVMPTNLNSYLRSNAIVKNPAIQLLAEEALELSQNIIDGASPEDIIDYLAYKGPVQQPSRIMSITGSASSQFTNMAAGFQGVGLISHSLYASSGGYLDPGLVSEYLRDRNTRIVYLGLLWQHSADIKFSDGLSLQSYLGKLAIDTKMAEEFAQLLTEFAHNGEKAANAAMSSRSQKDSEVGAGYAPYYQFFSALLDLFEVGVEVKATLSGIQKKSASLEDSLFLGIRHLNDLNFDIRQKHYAAAINDLMYVLRIFFPDMDQGTRKKIFTYGQFIATVATSETSDEVSAAIEAVALPPGSSRVKKENYFSAAINAYTGGTGGYETLTNNAGSTVLALSAPVGFTVSWKFKDKAPKANGKKRTPGSFSFFAPIIDVGALAAYRLNDPNSSDLPELAWSNLLSPGLYGVFGFANDLPISLGFGAQRGPNLRSITTGTQTTEVSGWRYGVFFSVDIPVFNLYVQGKKQRD